MNVLELSLTCAAGYAGALLAELGAQPLGGARDGDVCSSGSGWIEVTRLVVSAAAPSDVPATDASEVFLHHRKLEREYPSAEQGAASIDLGAYEVLLEDLGPHGLAEWGWTYETLQQRYPNLVIVSLSPFGREGPYAGWQGNDFLAQAVSGVMHCCGYDGEAPLQVPGEAALMVAGIHGASAALAAQLGAQRGEESAGGHIDISAQDAFMQHRIRHVAEYAYSGTLARREPRDPQGLHYRHTAMASDGWLYLLALREPWQDLAAFLGLGEFLSDQAFADGAPQPSWSDLVAPFERLIAAKSKYTWTADAAALGWTFAPIEDPFEIAASPQTHARGGMTSVAHPGGVDCVEIPPLPWLSEDSASS